MFLLLRLNELWKRKGGINGMLVNTSSGLLDFF